MTQQAKHILIAEDEKPLAHALELKLGHEGFAVSLAQNGEECLELMKKQSFDLVFLDLMMPVKDGFQVLESLQASGDKTPVIVLSNLNQREDEVRVLSLGAQKFYVKSDTPLTVIVEEAKKL